MKTLIMQNKSQKGTRISVLFVLVFTLTSFVTVLYAGDLPSGASILDKYIEASGGKDAFAKITNRVSKGTFELVNMGVKADITVYSQAPNTVHSFLKSDVLGEIQSGVTGDTVWELSVMRGPIIKEGPEKDNTIREATFDKFIHWKNIYKSAEYAAVDTVDGKECYKVVLTPETGFPTTLYINTATDLIIKAETVMENQMGQIPLEMIIGDYRKVDNVLLAHKVNITVMGQERIVMTDSIKQNVEIPDSIFILPAEITELKAGMNAAE